MAVASREAADGSAASPSFAEAFARTLRHMAFTVDLKPGTRVIDIGAGYGGAARYLARETAAQVTCSNL